MRWKVSPIGESVSPSGEIVSPNGEYEKVQFVPFKKNVSPSGEINSPSGEYEKFNLSHLKIILKIVQIFQDDWVENEQKLLVEISEHEIAWNLA